MNLSKSSILFLIFFVLAGNADAQDGLTESQKKEFYYRTSLKIEEFQHYMSNIVNNNIRHDVRKENVTSLLKLFIGEGESYDYYDEETDTRVYCSGVKMHSSSISIKSKTCQKLKRYIYKLYNPETGKSSIPYSKIILEAIEVLRIDNIVKVGDHYECVAYICKKFIGQREYSNIYPDEVLKKIRCYINYLELPSGKKIFDIKLGDVYVLSN